MKKLLIMMCVLFIINLVAIIIPLWSSENTMIILYRMAIFCNLAVFVPSITLIYREKGKLNKKIVIFYFRMAYSFKMFKIICKTVKKACNIKKQVI